MFAWRWNTFYDKQRKLYYHLIATKISIKIERITINTSLQRNFYEQRKSDNTAVSILASREYSGDTKRTHTPKFYSKYLEQVFLLPTESFMISLKKCFH